ncbi:hypothetical protein BJ508DRAFT_18502 [Ascobolus immersus RN42]|uniref:Uncharacterized protein n=1 Tax=Ascobolus immersus RN42 TaxID=1160509 RepID=A0A3N4HQK7_ASCIM|nr:hypothetical protein BJ508DRAFT_18502 [Ascobolus immersus RN42]
MPNAGGFPSRLSCSAGLLVFSADMFPACRPAIVCCSVRVVMLHHSEESPYRLSLSLCPIPIVVCSSSSFHHQTIANLPRTRIPSITTQFHTGRHTMQSLPL